MSPEHDTPVDTSLSYRRKARYAVAVVTITVVVLSLVWFTRQAVLLVFLGVAIGTLFFHASRWLSEKTGVPRGASLTAIVLLVLGTIAAAFYFGGPQVVSQGEVLVEQAPEVYEATRARLGIPPGAVSLPEGQGLGSLVNRTLGIFSSLVGIIAGVLVVLLVAIYTAASPSLYTSAVKRLVDHERQPFAQRVLDRSAEVLMGWLKGVGIAVLVLGTLAAVGLTVIGVPGALALAAFAAALTVIPNFGPFIGWTPALLVAFSQGTSMGLWTLGLAVVAQQTEGSFITPKVQGEMVKVGPAFIVAGQIVLGAIAGFLGVLLVVPVLAVGKVFLQELYIGPLVKGEPADPDAPPEHPRTVPTAALTTPIDAASE